MLVPIFASTSKAASAEGGARSSVEGLRADVAEVLCMYDGTETCCTSCAKRLACPVSAALLGAAFRPEALLASSVAPLCKQVMQRIFRSSCV